MRKLISFFIGLCILALMFGAIAGAAAIYDTARKIKIETYFFQPNNLSGQRVGVPATPSDLGPDKMRRRLVEKYLSEYFYVIPDTANVEKRMGAFSPLARMSTQSVFSQWQQQEGAYIKTLAEEGAFRTVRIIGEIKKPADSDFWTVEYEMKTWRRPNDMAEEPVVTRDVLYMGISDEYMMDFRQNIDIRQYLENGYDPAAIFRFGITAIGRQQDK
ncbi:MAG: hypothetical protein K2I81_04860 [Alphaproteobacteria bacterium]|nr:hypothetical protein [Alphaproteobacteria bacterium]